MMEKRILKDLKLKRLVLSGLKLPERVISVLIRTYRIITFYPHKFLANRLRWYQDWHKNQYCGRTHFSILIVYIFVLSIILSISHGKVYAVDLDPPSANASNLAGYKILEGPGIPINSWTNGGSPYFSWNPGVDEDSGIYGYCLYFGTNSDSDPVTTKGMLGTSPAPTNGNCQFLVTSTELDMATPGILASALTTSNLQYFLLIKAVDNVGNVYPGSAIFYFKFDNTPPNNPEYITSPSGFISSKDATLTWSVAEGEPPSDENSGLAGLQYRIGSGGLWYGDAHSGTGDFSDLLESDGSYITSDPPDYENLNEGVNTVYFRSWDNAGNVTASYVTAIIKINTSSSPSEPMNLAVTPSSNSLNSFAFSWDPPATYIGHVDNITYCYTVNTVPSVDSCNYTSAGATSLPAGAYATQPGVNTMYVVARDEAYNINYPGYSQIAFTANTTAPGIPLNTDVIDVSIMATSNWRLALAWDTPTNVGAGISSYKVYRSTDNVNFAFIGSSSSTTYIDAGLNQQTYYYYVAACDNTNNCGANSPTVSLQPTGKYSSPALLTSGPTISGVTTKKATITWSTDRTSDTKVAIGTSSGQYSPSEVGNSDQVTSHIVNLDNLAAGTTYYFQAKWTDVDDNTGLSQEFTFTTAPAPVLKEISTLRTSLNSANIGFTSMNATRVKIYYGQNENFDHSKVVYTSTSESTYDFELSELLDGVKYYYKLGAFDSENDEYKGSVFTFSTPPRPKISNVRFQPVEGEPSSTQIVSWQTNVPCNTSTKYGVLGTEGSETKDSSLVTEHEITINGLQDDSEYFFIAESRDTDGNLAVSDLQVFKTALDTRPPKVSEVIVESSIRGTGAESKGQIIVSWQTDEPSSSKVEYGEGSNISNFASRTSEDSELTTEHIVIISDLPTSKVYSIQPLSRDRAGNPGYGEVKATIIGRASDSVLTVIVNALQKVFGF